MKYPVPMPRPSLVGQPQPQAAQPTMMQRLSNNSDLLMQTGMGLLSGQTGAQQFAMGAQGLMNARQSGKDKAAQNKTLQFLAQRNPELAKMVQMGGISAADALKMDYQSRQGAQAEPTANMREFEFAKQNGFQGGFADWVKGKAGGTTVNVGQQGQPSIGSIPQGFQAIQDPETGAYRMERVPGGPEDLTESKAAQLQQDAQKAAVARQSIANIREKLTGGGMFDLPEAGVVGSRLANWGINQEAVDVKNDLASLQSIVSFDRLQAMREASPTGGALGAVSERELALLQASMGALSQDSSPEQLQQTLDFIDGIMAKFEQYPQAAQQAGASPAGQSDIQSLIDQYAD